MMNPQLAAAADRRAPTATSDGPRPALAEALFTSTPTRTLEGHARTFEETYEWIRPRLRRVPISRVINVTPMDFVGLPVWSAVTPLAKDLTVHAGKGASPAAARLSAVMEAIERVSGESVDSRRIVRATYAELSARLGEHAVLDPLDCDLPFETAYSPEREISWVEGVELNARAPIWVALDLVVSPATEKVCVGVETNGLASGNTLTEAAVHALYEVLERDAVSHEQFAELYADSTDVRAPRTRVVDPATVRGLVAEWLERIANEELTVTFQELTTEVEVPVYSALLLDPAFPGADGVVRFGGYGADLRRERALVRAITEAIQAHSIAMLGARDEFEGLRALRERNSMLYRRLETSYPRAFVDAYPGPEWSSDDLMLDLQEILARMRRSGLDRCIVVDLTRDDLEVPVVRVLVPGLSHPYGATRRRPTARLLTQVV